MATMKAVPHEILREQWRRLIREFNESELTVKGWCEGKSSVLALSYCGLYKEKQQKAC